MIPRPLHMFWLLLITSYKSSAEPTCLLVDRVIECHPGDEDYALKKGILLNDNSTTKIILSGCRINSIDEEAFNGLPGLTHINLSENKLYRLNPGILKETRRLMHLNVSFNRLVELPSGLFAGNEHLLVLDVKANSIELLQPGVFDPLVKLEHLDLSQNSLQGTFLNPNIFERNQNIKFLDFSRNDMRDTDSYLLQQFRKLQILNLDRCKLTEVPSFAVTVNLRTIKNLVLSGNQISELDNPTIFNNLDGLEYLDISFNIIKSVHEDVFRSLRKLKSINLRNNRIEQIPEKLFYYMNTVVTIGLSNNLITFVPVNAFRGSGVKYLNLASNQFTYLTDNFCLELRNTGVRLQKFYFNQNPWQCKCLLDILKEVNYYDIKHNSAKYDGAHPVCVSEQFDCKRHAEFNERYVTMYNKLINGIA